MSVDDLIKLIAYSWERHLDACDGWESCNCSRERIEAALRELSEKLEEGANRFSLRCPHCDKQGSNSPGAGGNNKCFHCGECGFVECEWSSPSHEYECHASAKLEGGDTRWEDWRKQLLDAWAKDHRATMTALLEGGPRKAEETTNTLLGGK